MPLASRLVPAISVFVLALISVLPWGLPPDGRYVLPLLPAIAIHYWASKPAERLAAGVAFAAGLSVDILTNGPLGYWSLIYLIGYLSAREVRGRTSAGSVGRWLAFLSSLGVLVLAAWAITSLYYLEIAAWQPFAWAALLAGLSYPVIAIVLRTVDPSPDLRTNETLARGM